MTEFCTTDFLIDVEIAQADTPHVAPVTIGAYLSFG
jgi:hypothetical protein